MGGDKKPDFVQPFKFTQVIGQSQMPDVDGIKGTGEDACLFHCAIFSS